MNADGFTCPEHLQDAFNEISDAYGFTEADLVAFGFEHVVTAIQSGKGAMATEAMKHVLKSRPVGGRHLVLN